MANTRPSGVENRNSQEESSPQRYGVNEAQYKELQNEATRMGYAGNIEKYKEDYAEKGQSDEDFAKSHF